jgi:hypothetical protein
VGHQAATLLRYLDAQRAHIFGAIEGLTDEQLLTPVLPSGWHCIGLLKHLALADEHYWFRCVVGGESFDFFPEGADADWQLEPGETIEDIKSLYRSEIERSNAIIAATSLDAPPRQRDPRWEDWGRDFPDLHDIVLHVLTETSIHAGHLDAARELIDGRQWVVV